MICNNSFMSAFFTNGISIRIQFNHLSAFYISFNSSINYSLHFFSSMKMWLLNEIYYAICILFSTLSKSIIQISQRKSLFSQLNLFFTLLSSNQLSISLKISRIFLKKEKMILKYNSFALCLLKFSLLIEN